MTLPACCIPSGDAEIAEILYCEYQKGGPPERAGLNYQNLPCPVWSDLLAAPEGSPSAGVVAKWRAVAEAVKVRMP